MAVAKEKEAKGAGAGRLESARQGTIAERKMHLAMIASLVVILTQAVADATLVLAKMDVAAVNNVLRDGPTLSSIRTPTGFHPVNEYPLRPVLFYGFHVLPSVVWTLIAPLQFRTSLRKRWPGLHRRSGYTFFSLSFVISLSGMVLIMQRATYSHADVLHLWFGFVPTFDFALLLLHTLFCTSAAAALYMAAIQRDYSLHRIWTIVHACLGLIIPLQRVWMYICFAAAWYFQPLGRHPPSTEWEFYVEKAAFAVQGWLGALSACVIAAWVLLPLVKAK